MCCQLHSIYNKHVQKSLRKLPRHSINKKKTNLFLVFKLTPSNKTNKQNPSLGAISFPNFLKCYKKFIINSSNRKAHLKSKTKKKNGFITGVTLNWVFYFFSFFRKPHLGKISDFIEVSMTKEENKKR